jgi:hypothetical protein
VQQLEKRLSEALGEQAWRQSGLGAPDDIDALKQRTVTLEPQVVDLRLQLEERGDELAAARAANRGMDDPNQHDALDVCAVAPKVDRVKHAPSPEREDYLRT